MKTFKSLPKDNDFFRVYAKFATGIAAGVIVSQIISALTEAGIIYQAVFHSLEVFGNKLALIGAVLGAALGVAMIELAGLRFFLPQSIDAFLFKRFSGLHLPMTLFSFLMAGALIIGSFFLSIEGKTDLVGNALNVAQEAEREDVAQKYQNSKEAILQGLKRDSNTLAKRYNELILAEQAKASASIELHRNELELWEGKQTRTGRNYETRISNAKGKIKAVEANLKASEARLKAELSQYLQQKESRYLSTSDSLKAIYSGSLALTNSKFQTKEKRYGIGAGLIVLLAVSFSIIGIILNRIFRKGAGIEETPLPTDYFFRPGILTEWYYAISERLQQLTRQRLTNFIAKTKEPPELSRIHSLYERDKLEQPRRQIGFHKYPPEEEGKASVSNATVITQPKLKVKNCLHCGKEYAPKVNWQKYCSPGCKEAYHANKHGGKVFNPKKYHQVKK